MQGMPLTPLAVRSTNVTPHHNGAVTRSAYKQGVPLQEPYEDPERFMHTACKLKFSERDIPDGKDAEATKPEQPVDLVATATETLQLWRRSAELAHLDALVADPETPASPDAPAAEQAANLDAPAIECNEPVIAGLCAPATYLYLPVIAGQDAQDYEQDGMHTSRFRPRYMRPTVSSSARIVAVDQEKRAKAKQVPKSGSSIAGPWR